MLTPINHKNCGAAFRLGSATPLIPEMAKLYSNHFKTKLSSCD